MFTGGFLDFVMAGSTHRPEPSRAERVDTARLRFGILPRMASHLFNCCCAQPNLADVSINAVAVEPMLGQGLAGRVSWLMETLYLR